MVRMTHRRGERVWSPSGGWRVRTTRVRGVLCWYLQAAPCLRFRPVECLKRTTEDKYASVLREGVVRAVLELEWGGGLRAVQRGGLRHEKGSAAVARARAIDRFLIASGEFELVSIPRHGTHEHRFSRGGLIREFSCRPRSPVSPPASCTLHGRQGVRVMGGSERVLRDALAMWRRRIRSSCLEP